MKIFSELPSLEEYKSVKQRIDAIENGRKAQLKIDVDQDKKLKQLKLRLDSMSNLESKLSELETIMETLHNLETRLEQSKESQKKKNKMFEQDLKQKANLTDLEQLHSDFENEMSDLKGKIASMKDEMTDLSRKVTVVRQKIRDVLDVLKRKDEENGDAMISRKQLGPVNCASCDKNVFNLLGSAAEFSPAKQMPARETSERIARYGQGFSKMLSTIQPLIQSTADNIGPPRAGLTKF